MGVLSTGGLGSYLAQMLQALLALAGVCVLAWVVLRTLARRGFGVGGARGAWGVQVLERIPLDARRALFVVRAGGRTLLLGTGDRGAPRLITELQGSAEPNDAPAAAPEEAAASGPTGEAADDATEPAS